MTDTSDDFDVTTPRRAASRRGGLVAGLVLGLIAGGGLTALWAFYGSAPQPRSATASSETAQAIKDLQTTEQRIADQLQSLQQALVSNQAETKHALAAEQVETKRLSDQVTALSGKLDALQQSFASAQQQSPPPEPPPAPAKRRR
jgi:hypothetical protein